MNFMLALQYTDVGHYMEPLKVQLEGYGFSGLRCTSDCNSKVSSHRDIEKSLRSRSCESPLAPNRL